MHFHTNAPCWWFVHVVYKKHLRIILPKEEVIETKDEWHQLILEHQVRFERADPGPYKLVLIRYKNGVMHIGIMEDTHKFLHVLTPQAGVCRADLIRYKELGYVVGTYRYIG